MLVVSSNLGKCLIIAIVVEGEQRKGRPRKTWYQVMGNDLRSLKIDCHLPQYRTEWKIAINPFSPSCIVKFSQLEPTLFVEQVWENFSFNL